MASWAFLGLLCLMYAFSYENVLFYVSSGFTAYSHILFKIIKMAAQNLFGPYGLNISFLLHNFSD